ncbi:MAG: glycosyltransferase [Candidatus Aminicenantia bacterium]
MGNGKLFSNEMRICFFGGYQSDYTRFTIIKKGLLKNKVDIIECNVSFGLKFWLRYPLLLIKYLKYWKKHDFFFIPAFRHKDVPLAKFLSFLTRKPIIFDPLVSRYETIVLDWKKVDENSWQAKWNFKIDKIAFRMSDLILCDTSAHLKYYQREFLTPREKLRCLPVGVDEDIFYSQPAKPKKSYFLVQFYGSYLPLHGIEYIVQAAKIIQEKDDQIKFELIGTGRTFPEIRGLINQLEVKNIILLPEWVPFSKLPVIIARADICLGIFGQEEKANRVVPNKIFQALAMRKPVITGDTEAIKEFFEHKKHLFLCRAGDASSLASAILELRNNKSLQESIAHNGHCLIQEKFTTIYIGKKVKTIIKETFPNL